MLTNPHLLPQSKFRAFHSLPSAGKNRRFWPAAVLLFLAGCGVHPSRQRIAAIPRNNERGSLSERAGLEEVAYKSNVDVYWNGPSSWDLPRQIDLIESAVRARSYGIAINPGSLFADNTAIHEALEAGIPVVIMQDPIRTAPAPHLYFALEDAKAGADLVAQRLNRVLQGSGEVALLGLDPLHPGSRERIQALESVLPRQCPHLRLDDPVAGPFGSGYLEMEAHRILDENPHLNAIVALNEASGIAAAAVLRSRHLADKVRLIVFDQSLDLFILLRRGEIDSIVVQDMRDIGEQAATDILADRKGLHLAQITYLKPLLLTRENIDDDTVQRFLGTARPHL
jgi:ribose transport system substrate-binding protein